MAVITISREFGAGGLRIAEESARELGYHLVDKNSMGRLLASYGLIEFSREYDSEFGIWATFDSQLKEMVSMLDRVMRAVARHGNAVILGRGAFAVLGGYENALNVRIKAPFVLRVDRVMAEQGLTQRSRAEAAVREGDKVRGSFVQSFYGVRPDALNAFDLVIDTGKIDGQAVVRWLVQAARALEAGQGGGPVVADIEADVTLDSAVDALLGCTLKHGR